LKDHAGKRRVAVAKSGSNTTVVWNPWESGAAKLADMDPTEWHEFVAIETVNAAVDAITLAPGATHTMQAQVSIEELGISFRRSCVRGGVQRGDFADR
jgi:glucose-6-phosphate 1-epimerase